MLRVERTGGKRTDTVIAATLSQHVRHAARRTVETGLPRNWPADAGLGPIRPPRALSLTHVPTLGKNTLTFCVKSEGSSLGSTGRPPAPARRVRGACSAQHEPGAHGAVLDRLEEPRGPHGLAAKAKQSHSTTLHRAPTSSALSVPLCLSNPTYGRGGLGRGAHLRRPCLPGEHVRPTTHAPADAVLKLEHEVVAVAGDDRGAGADSWHMRQERWLGGATGCAGGPGGHSVVR